MKNSTGLFCFQTNENRKCYISDPTILLMHHLFKLDEIVQSYLSNVNQQITECKKQLTITQQAIERLKETENISSPKDLINIIQQKSELLINNYMLISQQMHLIKHYTILSDILKTRVNRANTPTIEKNNFNDLSQMISYHEKQNQQEVINILKQYLPSNLFSSIKEKNN